jgi:fructose-specific phosphotransferase system IIC component
MEHILEKYIAFTDGNLRGFVFGFVHVSIMLVGYYSGWSINRLLKLSSNGYIAGVFGAALSHIIADLVASYIDPHIRSMVFGIVFGGIVPLLLVPILEKYVVKSKNHIVVGDHDDIKKDLKSH